jgi:hypothetical protein
LNIYACYSWDMELNVGLEASFDNVSDWKGIQTKSRKVNSAEAYITRDEMTRRILDGS